MSHLQSAREIQWDELLAKGWCIHQLRHLDRICTSSTTFSYLLQLEKSSARTVDHSVCREEPQCIAYNVDMRNYKSRHTEPDCACPMVEVPYKRLLKTINSKSVPLISIEEVDIRGGGAPVDLALKVHTRTPESCYTAVSHVWADGLGNPKQNALPYCQLKSLQRRLGNRNQKHLVGTFQLHRHGTDCQRTSSGWTRCVYRFCARTLISR